MERLGFYLLGFIALFSFYSTAQIQCAVDVSIVEGASITMCEGAGVTINGSTGFIAYAWTGPVAGGTQGILPTGSGEYILSAIDGVACVSIDTIQVVVNVAPTPNIVSSEGPIICPSTGTTLSTDIPFTSYEWEDGTTDPTLITSTASTYNLTVFDSQGCSGTGSIVITQPNFSLTSTEVSGCGGTGISLQATGGTSYAWSTGEFGSSIIVDPSAITNYSVSITVGTCTENLSLEVSPATPFEYSLPDTVYIHENDSYFLNGPTGFNSYYWSPSDQLDNANAQGAIFSGTETQLITIDAIHPTGCNLSDNILVVVVGLTIPHGFSPNGDPYNQTFVIPEIISENYETKLTVWNRWGEIVLDDPNYLNTWEGTCESDLCIDGGGLPEGTYFYNIDIHGVTFKGYITLKR